jgi:molybdate transport system substrate-binding protein
MRNRRWFLALLFASLAGCGRGTDGDKKTVTVLVASSAKDAVAELAALFETEHKAKIAISADDSSKLAQQILKDAPADLFLSANETWANAVRDKGYAKEIKPLLGNRLVLIVPTGNPAALKAIEDVAKPEVRKLALAGPKVPAGMYARQALEALNLLKDLEKSGRIVSGDNVRTTLAFVERGEAEAGVVYDTDAKISTKVEVVAEFPEKLHEPIRYPLVLLNRGAENAAAKEFFEFLQTEESSRVFQKYGFTLVPR